LKKEGEVDLGVKTTYRILGEKYILRTRWKKNQARGSIPQVSNPREVVQMDTVCLLFLLLFLRLIKKFILSR
jgi:hypothetical protein